MLSSTYSWLFNPQWIAILIWVLIPLAFDSFISLCICQQPIFRIYLIFLNRKVHRFLPNKIRNVHSLWWRVERMPLMYYFVHCNCTYCIHPTWKLKLSVGAKWQLNPSRCQARHSQRWYCGNKIIHRWDFTLNQIDDRIHFN